jgi:hypothetical protein
MTCDVTHPAIAINVIAAATAEALETLIIGISHVLIYESPSEQLARGKGVNDLPVLAGGTAEGRKGEFAGDRHPWGGRRMVRVELNL